MLARRTLTIAAAVMAATLVLAAAASAKLTTQTDSSGAVTATFTFTGSPPKVSHARLKIVRAGQALYDQPVFSPQCGTKCSPALLGVHASSVRVLDIESSGQPDVVLELYSGGANCCFIDQVFSLDPGTMTYVKTEHNFASAGAGIKRLRHRWRFVSDDDADFKYEFTDGADSGAPIRIWSFAARHFHDVTLGYPKLIAADASRWLRLFRHHLVNGVGLIAAWAADEELLGHDPLVQSTLAAQARKGDLRDGSNGLATGRRFIAKLNRFLRKLGYER
jgi:hypothetical protein